MQNGGTFPQIQEKAGLDPHMFPRFGLAVNVSPCPSLPSNLLIPQ